MRHKGQRKLSTPAFRLYFHNWGNLRPDSFCVDHRYSQGERLMRACLQRVTHARVLIPREENRVCGQIENGFLVLLGISRGDSSEEARVLARKICRLRVFDDAEGKMNLDISRVGGSILVVSQFTLYANSVHGNRPGFTEAAPPEEAERLYKEFVSLIRTEYAIRVETGVFREMMLVELINDGPITIWLDTDLLMKKGASY